MKTKIFTLLLAVAASIGTMFAADAIGRLNYGGLYYVLYTDYTATLTNNNGAPYSFSNPTRVTIPSSIEYNNESYTVTAIADGTFSLCGNLYEIVIPETIWGIGNRAFSYTGLDNVVIPNSVTFIGETAFLGCSRMTSIILSEELTSIPKGCFQGCSSLESIVIPDKVTSIGQVAFWYCSGLTSVTIGESVSSIYTGCFNSTDNITTVIWKARNCDSYNFGSQVISFTFGNNVEVIPSSICDGMNLLNDITIPSGVIGIGNYAFRGCSGLTSVTISNNVTSIGSSAFSGCSGMTSVTIGNSVRSIGSSAFSGCIGLTSITIPNSVTSIGSNAFSGCSGMTSVIIGNSVTSIGNSAFSDCSDLSGELIIPNSVTSIGSNAFANCIGLTSIVIGNSVTNIGSSAFADCSNLSSVTFPASVTRIDNGAFNNCTSLQFIKFLGETAPIMQFPFANTNDCPIYIPSNSYTSYSYALPTYYERLTLSSDCVPSYVVTFVDWNGQVLKIEQVEEGHSATAPANPTREGYTFTGWDKDFSNVQSDLIVTAQYTQNSSGTTSFTVTFQDWDGTVLKSEQVDKGKSATAPTNPTREGYTFTGWDKTFSNVQSDLMITAQYKKNNPSSPFVGFESTDAHSLATQIYSESLIQNITNVTLVETDAAAHKYSINLVNGGEGTFSMGGVVFSYTNEESGKTAYKTYIQYIQPNGVDREIRIPTVRGQQIRVTLVENCAGMLVDGVSKDFVAGDNIITANGSSLVMTNPTAKPKITAIKPYAFAVSTEYTVTFKDWNGKILKAEIVAEGMSATAPADPVREGYRFIGWDKSFNNVQSDLTVTAQYERMTEAVENVQAENITSRKVMINGQIYILRGDKTYTVTGQEVK